MTLKPLKIGKHTIKYPIIQGGMGLGISWDQLAGNVALNGGLGVISTVGTGYYKDNKYSAKDINHRPMNVQNFYSRNGLKAIVDNA